MFHRYLLYKTGQVPEQLLGRQNREDFMKLISWKNRLLDEVFEAPALYRGRQPQSLFFPVAGEQAYFPIGDPPLFFKCARV